MFLKIISRSFSKGDEQNRRHYRLSFGQVLTTFTYEHGIRDIQRLHRGECRIRLPRNQPREIFRTHSVLASECR